MQSAEISSRALRFFEQRGHIVVPSASLIADDPTLLLINAGMAPFKSYFLGEVAPPFPRATSVQKCVRTVDIEEVGKTTRHASFFQMIGNFSFGDYFKDKAIPYAWEFLTRSAAEGGLGLPESKLWVTVYTEDDETERIWRTVIGVPAERIQRLGMADNFWSMGVPGPCGPSSEICFDRGPRFGREGGPIVDGERYLEIWNLVFMQNVRGEGPAKEGYPIIGDLPAKNIDTGLGLERVAAVLQGVDTIFEIDTSRQVLGAAAELSGACYGKNTKDDIALRVVADHILASVMLVADGVTPSNEGRGYILRRILRRAVRMMRLLGSLEPVVGELVARAIAVMSPTYPELATSSRRIADTIVAEEASFLQTLKSGTAIFDFSVGQMRQAGSTVLSGDQAFQLHDTYGFPIDLTLEMAAEQGLSVDEERFRWLMNEQRNRAKKDARAKKAGHVDVLAYRQVLDSVGSSAFCGYEEAVTEGVVRGLLVSGTPVEAAGAGDTVDVVLDRTCFYAEGGGQLADQGVIRTGTGALIEVTDAQTPVQGLIVHRGTVAHGEIRLGAEAVAEIDAQRRRAISRSHTATHMVHKALRDALGESAAQAGSENSPGRFRFDFNAPSAVPESVLTDVEQRVNEILAQDLAVRTELMSRQQARDVGAIAIFGEKYGNQVRVVSVGDWSRELCGGTHVDRSTKIGLIKLLGESSIGVGVRRVEALVGTDAFRFLAREHVLVAQLTETLKVRPEELPERVTSLLGRLRDAEKEIEQLRTGQIRQWATQIAATAQNVSGLAMVIRHLSEPVTTDELRKLVLDVRSKVDDRSAIVAITSLSDDKPIIAAAVGDTARERGIKAGDLVRVASKILKGGGGGKPDIAQGGGTDPCAIPDALQEIARMVGNTVNQ
jgi:alanyl-tRNA synthetase